MRYIDRLGRVLATVFMLVLAAASSAYALPDISVTLSGGTYPLTMKVTALTVGTKLSNVVKEDIKSEGGSIYAALDTLGHLGTYEALFTHAEIEDNACFSEEGGTKDSSGEILTKGTWHLVYTSLAGSAQGLQLGVLALASPVTVKCGTKEIEVKGDLLASVDTLAGTETEEYTSASGILAGNGDGVPNIRFFYNEAGTSVKVKLETNLGTGFKESAEEVGELLTSTASEGKMPVVTSR